MPPIKINQPDIKLVNKATGEEMSKHRSPEEAMEAASLLPAGEYAIVRPSGSIVVTAEAADASDPDGTDIVPPPIPTIIRFLTPIGEPFEQFLLTGAPYPMSHAEAQAMLIEVEVEADKGPVEFAWADQHHIENSAPFQMNGDGRYVAFDAGIHEIVITAGDVEFTVSIEVAAQIPGDVDPEEPTDPQPEPGPTEVIPFARKEFPASYYDPLGKIDEIKSKFEFLPRDENGWTIITPNFANLVAYVDSERGDDGTAVLVPQGTAPADIVPFRTLPAALEALPITRDGDEMKSGAHHVLLHDDQSFSTTTEKATRIPSGESHTERLVIGRYGEGLKPPVIDDFGHHEIRFWGTCRFVIIQGVDLYNKYRDPHHPDFVGWGNTNGPVKGGMVMYSGEVGSSYILLEGLNMNYCSPHTTGKGHTQIVAYRCMTRNTYSETSHQQGFYSGGSDLIMFDDCIFDHDGWFKQREKEIKLNTKAEGRATYFNHNIYASNVDYLWLRNPIFMRASSIGTKLTSNGVKGADVDSITSSYVLIENPYYLEGEIGISAGGNTDHNTGHRWQHMYIIDPVFEAIGHSQPTNRTLAWGIDVQDWKQGAVVNPLFIPSDNNNLTNTYALNILGHCDDVKLLNTIAFDIGASHKVTGAYVIRYREQGQSNMSGVIEEGSIIQNPNSKCKLLSDDVVDGITRKDCTYFSNNEDQSVLFKFDETYYSVEDAMAHPSMENCQFAEIVFEDAGRNIKTYMASLGLEPTAEAFALECGKQDFKNWRPEFTAQAVNAYLREGYTPIGLRVTA
ncbi:hypothetical protein N9J88_03295 [Porticoccaceae bacterium]|nr:hypothetical protein [Porticoccaceae bacterium]